MPKAGKEKQGLWCLWVTAPHSALAQQILMALEEGEAGPTSTPLATEAGETKQRGPL